MGGIREDLDVKFGSDVGNGLRIVGLDLDLGVSEFV